MVNLLCRRHTVRRNELQINIDAIEFYLSLVFSSGGDCLINQMLALPNWRCGGNAEDARCNPKLQILSRIGVTWNQDLIHGNPSFHKRCLELLLLLLLFTDNNFLWVIIIHLTWIVVFNLRYGHTWNQKWPQQHIHHNTRRDYMHWHWTHGDFLIRLHCSRCT